MSTLIEMKNELTKVRMMIKMIQKGQSMHVTSWCNFSYWHYNDSVNCKSLPPWSCLILNLIAHLTLVTVLMPLFQAFDSHLPMMLFLPNFQPITWWKEVLVDIKVQEVSCPPLISIDLSSWESGVTLRFLLPFLTLEATLCLATLDFSLSMRQMTKMLNLCNEKFRFVLHKNYGPSACLVNYWLNRFHTWSTIDGEEEGMDMGNGWICFKFSFVEDKNLSLIHI